MFSSSFAEHITNARAIVAHTLYPSTLLGALNASKGFAAICPSRHTTAPTSSAASVAAAIFPDASKVADAPNALTPQYAGAVIVASVGLGYASLTGTMIQQRLSRLGVDTDVDIEVPRAPTPYIPAHWSMATFLSRPANSTNATMQSNKVSIGVQTSVLLPSSLSTSPTWSSPTGSDLSFECATPPTAAAGVQAPRIVSVSETASPLATSPSSSDLRVVGEAVDALEVKFAELAAQYREALDYSARLDALGSGVGLDFRVIQYDDNDNDDSEGSEVATEWSGTDSASDIAFGGTPGSDEDCAEADDAAAVPDDAPSRAPCELYNPHSGAKYAVSGIVGEGSFARVAAAYSNGRSFGIKVVHKANVYGHPEAREKLLLEKEVMADVAGFNTERLVRLHESWEDRRNIYFAMVSMIVFDISFA